jgi:hypothetical protein
MGWESHTINQNLQVNLLLKQKKPYEPGVLKDIRKDEVSNRPFLHMI